MPMQHARRAFAAVMLTWVVAAGGVGPARSETVTLKTGVVYKGAVDKDGTIITIFDGLKRVVVRETKVASVEDDALEQFETFHVEQPLTVHAGVMPPAIVGVKGGAWELNGRRQFEYLAPGSQRPVRMTVAINELGPRIIRVRGVDGFFKTLLPTNEVPRDVVMSLLNKVDQQDQAERLKVGRFLIQAQWYEEALAELDRLEADFPGLKDTVARVREQVVELKGERRFQEVEIRRDAQQPLGVRGLLASFPLDGLSADAKERVRVALRSVEEQEQADRELAQRVRETADALGATDRATYRQASLEMLGDLASAPDAVRDRFQKMEGTGVGSSTTTEARFARALSGWIGGDGLAQDDLNAAGVLWQARGGLQKYLSSTDEATRAEGLAILRALTLPGGEGDAGKPLSPGILSQIALYSRPPLRSELEEAPGVPRRLRARDDTNQEPTEYVVVLPPEYHPQRRYPALVVIHGGEGPEAVAETWRQEAGRRGFILVAPEYGVKGLPRDYRFSESEHAAVEIAMRDARRRLSIDSNRVFLAGSVLGGYMAWDLGLAHPDRFAGVAVISGIPAKYAWAYKDNAQHVPLYVAMGDLAPTETDLIFPWVHGLVSKNYDVVLVEYYKRGLEMLPEEIPHALEWMTHRKREPYPKEYEFVSARNCDNRLYGVVVKEFDPERVKSPEQVDPLGKNLKPARITRRDRTLANLLDLETSGVDQIDLWLGPPNLDVNDRFEIRVNGKSAFRGRTPVDIATYLEDLRLRGDREQTYWLKYSATVGRSRR